MRLFRFALPAILSAVLLVSAAQAHFIFVVPEPANQPQVIKVYLSELAEADDPSHLPLIEKAQAWEFDEEGQAKTIPLKIEGDALVGSLAEQQAGHPVIVKHTFGVMSRGPAPFLLNYYAKAYKNTLPGNWSEVDEKEKLPLEIVPELKGADVAFKVLWQGKPAIGSQVTVESPVLEKKIQGNTDDQGLFTAKLEKAGLYSVRALHVDETAGEHEGKAYKSIKHYSTLTLPFTPAQIAVTEQQWPNLPKGMTSFGSAVVGDDLYTYGGNYGGAHKYAEAEQSGDFFKLNLKNGKEWEALPGGPRLTGLAMVSHGGKLYRVGGFTISDVPDKDAVLNSRDLVACFDPATGSWTDLPPLPEPRSSHDVAVLDNKLYVVGGWSMKAADGDNDQGWLKTAYTLDLAAAKPEWKAIPEAPFERRAISTVAHHGKLYVIGGMQSENGTTTKVSIFDPQMQTWSEGPSILGDGMDGFGTAACDVDGHLVVTTMSGSIQVLSADGSHWEYLGQLQTPRFFHESPAWNHGVVAVGGASMMTGKAKALEFLPIGSLNTADKAALLK